jgi:N-methylhydantoinase A
VISAVGARLGLDSISIAEQALEVAHFKMAQAIRELTVERGLDPRDFSVCAFGGAGPLHAAFVADELDINRIIIPAEAGAFSAWGMLQGDLRHDVSVTYYRRFQEAQTDISDALQTLRDRVLGRVKDDGADLQALRYEPSAEIRYTGQEYSLLVPLPNDAADEALLQSFHDAYFLRYGHSQPDAPVEFVSLRMAGVVSFGRTSGFLPQPSLGDLKPINETKVLFDGKAFGVPVYSRRDLGGAVPGPAIVVEESTTTLVPKSWSIEPIKGNHLVMERN